MRSVFLAVAFTATWGVLLWPASGLVDPLTHRRIDPRDWAGFPILVVHGAQPRVVRLQVGHPVPALSNAETYLVPAGKDKVFQRYLNDHAPHLPDVGWMLRVGRPAPGRQRIELYLMGDGYSGGVYDATDRTVTPLYVKSTGPAFSLVFGGAALGMNIALWGGAMAARQRIRRRWA